MTVPKSINHRAMGSAIDHAVTVFYNEELWKQMKGQALSDRMADLALRQFEVETRTGFVDSSVSTGEMRKVVEEGARGFLKTLVANKLLSQDARAQVKVRAEIDGIPFGGIIDILFSREDTGVTLLDGKNSTGREKYLDGNQLRWYAMIYQNLHGKIPERLGFVHFRFPHDPVSGEPGLDFVTCSARDIAELQDKAREALIRMGKEIFDPTPSPDACRFCDYEKVCEARNLQREATSAKRKKSLPVLPEEAFNMGVSE